MTSRYAENTSVSVEKSRSEIERTLERYGASTFGYIRQDNRALIEFVYGNRRIRFILPLPDRSSTEFRYTPTRRTERTDAQAYEAWEQACRQRWRALNIAIKAKLEAVEAGISTFDSEFLAHMVLPNGATVGDSVLPEIDRAWETSETPATLLALGSGLSV